MVEPRHQVEFTAAQLVRLRYLASQDAIANPTPQAENLKRKLTEYLTEIRGAPLPEVVSRTA